MFDKMILFAWGPKDLAESIVNYIKDGGASHLLYNILEIFLTILDFITFTVMNYSYRIFVEVAGINLFGGTVNEAMNFYNNFTKNIYSILAIVMIFFFSYQLILMIINPEGGGKKNGKKLFTDTVISVVAILLLPTLFNYMGLFQNHILQDGTITNLFLGNNGPRTTSSASSIANRLTVITYSSMLHPKGFTYSDFFDEYGEIRDTSEIIGENGTFCADVTADDAYPCTEYAEALRDATKVGNPMVIFADTKFLDYVLEYKCFEYNFLISAICGALISWFIIGYITKVGYRAIKIGFFEIIAPIALVMKIFPKTEGTFKTWISELSKTYLDLFLRLIVISFLIQMCLIMPMFIKNLFTDMTSVGCIATVFLIIGLFKFGKDCPKLVEDLFKKGDLFKGIDLKPFNKDLDGFKKGYETIKGGVYGAYLEDDKKKKFGGFLRGAYNSGRYGFATGKANVDALHKSDVEARKSGKSAFGMRMEDRMRGFIGLPSSAEVFKKAAEIASDTFEYNGIKSKKQMDDIRENNNNKLSAVSSINEIQDMWFKKPNAIILGNRKGTFYGRSLEFAERTIKDKEAMHEKMITTWTEEDYFKKYYNEELKKRGYAVNDYGDGNIVIKDSSGATVDIDDFDREIKSTFDFNDYKTTTDTASNIEIDNLRKELNREKGNTKKEIIDSVQTNGGIIDIDEENKINIKNDYGDIYNKIVNGVSQYEKAGGSRNDLSGKNIKSTNDKLKDEQDKINAAFYETSTKSREITGGTEYNARVAANSAVEQIEKSNQSSKNNNN